MPELELCRESAIDASIYHTSVGGGQQGVFQGRGAFNFGSRKIVLSGELMMQVRQVLVWWQVTESLARRNFNLIRETYHP